MATVAIRFCTECNNLLYPHEEKSPDESRLVFACRHCTHTEPADPAMPIRVSRPLEPIETTALLTDLASDPTLPRTDAVKCPRCGGTDALFFQSGGRGKDEGMKLFYACAIKGCGKRWVETVQGEIV